MRRAAREGNRKSIFDPVHGIVTLSGAPLALMGDPAVQRLWGIRQTGLANLVFPGANHTRLEHSLGVYWVARKMADRVGLPDHAADAVMAAGLLHDLGHGPLSHTLDPPMREVLGVDHERRSRDIVMGRRSDGSAETDGSPSEIPAILERYRISPREVSALIDPPPGRAARSLGSAILHSAIDADRIDYLQRDAHYTGVAHGAIDASRLLETVRSHSRRLAWAGKGLNAVEGFLVGRSLMYSSVYYHKTVRAAEVMVQAAVERIAGYPASARPLFSGTDGDLFAALHASGGRARELARSLRERRLHKRVFLWRRLDPSVRRTLGRLLGDPEGRRAREDEIAEHLDAPPGSVLLDLAGLSSRRSERDDWAAVAVLEEERLTYPFRSPGLWRTLAMRPPTHWPASVYAEPRWAGSVRRWVARHDGAID